MNVFSSIVLHSVDWIICFPLPAAIRAIFHSNFRPEKLGLPHHQSGKVLPPCTSEEGKKVVPPWEFRRLCRPDSMGVQWMEGVIQLMLVYLAKETCKKSKGVLMPLLLHMCVDRIDCHHSTSRVRVFRKSLSRNFVENVEPTRVQEKKWKLKHFNQSPLWSAEKFFASMCPWTFRTFCGNSFRRTNATFLSNFVLEWSTPPVILRRRFQRKKIVAI